MNGFFPGGLGPIVPLPEPIRIVAHTFPFTGVVAHGDEETFTVVPDRLYRPRRLVIAPECAPYYDVMKIQSGSMLLLEGPVAASTFPPIPAIFADLNALRNQVVEPSLREAMREFLCLFDKCDFQTVQPGQCLKVTVRHRSVCPVHPDCVALATSCRGVPLHAHWEGMVVA